MKLQKPRHARHGFVATMVAGIQWIRDSRVAVYSIVSSLCATVLVFIFSFLFFRPTVVYGESMMPSLLSNDVLLLNCINYKPAYGDIAVIRRPNDDMLIKRVIAVGGDTVYIDPVNQCVYRNGEKLEEPYISCPTPAIRLTGEVKVPDGHIYVLGDNRANSHDSRYSDIGMVSLDAVIGKAVYRFYPFKTAGKLSVEE
ncbi:MAG: signal peptidase I [Clostridia bacterium]|nr:signal peptidase I [Clostridia bacterium]